MPEPSLSARLRAVARSCAPVGHPRGAELLSRARELDAAARGWRAEPPTVTEAEYLQVCARAERLWREVGEGKP